jgi:uncharacterized protein with GYD domain
LPFDAIVQAAQTSALVMIREDDMPLFLASIKLSAASTKAVVDKPQDRRPAARAALEAAGCTLKDYYFALGPADVIVVYEAPDAITAAAVSMTLGAAGTASSVETMQLFTMEEAMTAMTKAGQVQRSYKPPAAT